MEDAMLLDVARKVQAMPRYWKVSRSKNLPLHFQYGPCQNMFGVSETLACVRPRKDFA